MAQQQPSLRVLSLGAGVQSTTLALMAAHGDIAPPPDCAIFADTGWEPRAVYEHLAWLRSPNVLPFPVHVVGNGNLRDNILARRNTTGGLFSAVPWYIINPDGSHGLGRRQCTSEYKLTPLMWKMRDLLGVGRRTRIPAGAVEVWVGISLDEVLRMKPARQQWQTTKWPLIDAGMTRRNCLGWLRRHDYPEPPKSACIGCPFHSNRAWRALRDGAPEEWADAVAIDAALREGNARGMAGVEYMHASCQPLDEVDLSTAIERGQGDLFINECEGMCGV